MLVGVGNFGLQKGVAKFRVGLRYEKMLSLCSCLVPADRALEVVTLQTARRYFHARCTGPRILPEMAICWLAHHVPRQAYCWTHCDILRCIYGFGGRHVKDEGRRGGPNCLEVSSLSLLLSACRIDNRGYLVKRLLHHSRCVYLAASEPFGSTRCRRRDLQDPWRRSLQRQQTVLRMLKYHHHENVLPLLHVASPGLGLLLENAPGPDLP